MPCNFQVALVSLFARFRLGLAGLRNAKVVGSNPIASSHRKSHRPREIRGSADGRWCALKRENGQSLPVNIDLPLACRATRDLKK